MGRFIQFLVPVVLAFLQGGAFADGGRLTLQASGGEGMSFLWASGSTRLVRPRSAVQVLDRGRPEPVKVFEYGGQPRMRLVLSVEPPWRLFSDWNGDGVCQSEELFFGQGKDWQDILYENVLAGVSVGDSTRVLSWDFRLLRSYSLEVASTRGRYEGTLDFQGVQYPARLGFRSPFATRDEINAILILDANRDGVWDYFSDPCLPGRGLGYLGDGPVSVDSAFEGDSVSVSLSPCTGPRGELIVEGKNLQCVLLQGQPIRWEWEGGGQFCLLSPPVRQFARFSLPEGEYKASFVLLQSASDDEAFFINRDRDDPSVIRIVPDSSQRLTLGGPLSLKLKVETDPLGRRVQLDLQSCRNAGGVEFVSVSREELRRGESASAPRFQIVDAGGKEVASGQFAYG